MTRYRYVMPSRRALLSGLAAGAGAFAIAQGQAQDSNVDVVVVGAGAAGIAAGIALKSAGVSYRILEADGRVGGRALTDTTTFKTKDKKSAVPFDIGCAWIHAYHKGDPFADWSMKYDFETQAHDLGLTGLYYDKTPYSSLMVTMEHEDEERAHCLMERAGDVPAGDVITDWRKPMDAAATYMGPMDMAVDFKTMSTADFSGMADYEPNYLVREGYGMLVKRVALDADLDITKDCAVTAINRSALGVEVVTARHGTISAKAVIVTASIGVLKSGAIRFPSDMPPAFQDALQQLEMGLLAKIPLQIPGIGHYIYGVRPYDNALQIFKGGRDIYFLAWPWDTDLMVGFVGGDFGWQLSRAGQGAAVAFAKEKIGDLFGSDVPRRVTNALLTPWATNRLTLGAYSAAKPGGFKAREMLRNLGDKQIFFAGEAVGPCGMYATCSGAYMSGVNTAWDVITALTGKTPPDGATYKDCEKVEPPKTEKKCPEAP